MGWFWNKTPSTSSTDPLRDLDPSLRDFLSKESPIKYKPSPPPFPPPFQPKRTEQPPSSISREPTPSEPSTQDPGVPPESLYPDGRYAHLWTSYRPLSAIAAASKSDQEKLNDVLDGYKARKAQIGRAAVENCVEEQIRVDECYRHGGVVASLTMCREEGRAFDRCYGMQSRFLKALGYLSTYDRPPEVDEQIQMHADTLYHRMLSQEKAIEEAKAAGQPIPTFAPILAPENTVTTTAPTTAPTTSPTPSNAATSTIPAPKDSKPDLPALSSETRTLLNEPAQQKLREKLKDMTPSERELEERSVQMEARTAGDIAVRMREVGEGRKRRREEGKGDTADTIAGWFGW